MLHTARTVSIVCVLATIVSTSAAAQPVSRRFIRPVLPSPPIRAVVSINGGYQGSTTEFADSFDFTRNQESGTTRVTYPIDAGPTFDIGAGVRIRGQLGVGVAVTRFTRNNAAAATSSIPHPFFLQQNRDVAGEADIKREETSIHLQAQYWLPLTGRLQVTVMAGPSVLQVNQSVVTDVNYTEQYPFDEATFAGVDVTPVKAAKVGFNIGADVRWMFTPNVGVGAVVRFSRATIELDAAQDRTLSIKAGGAQVGVGVRVGF